MKGSLRVSGSSLSMFESQSIDIGDNIRLTNERPGKTEKVGGVECYIATPTGDYPKDKVVLFLTDVFGIPLINNKVSLPFGSQRMKLTTHSCDSCSPTASPVMATAPSSQTSFRATRVLQTQLGVQTSIAKLGWPATAPTAGSPQLGTLSLRFKPRE